MENKRYVLLDNKHIIDTSVSYAASHHGHLTGLIVIGIDMYEEDLLYFYRDDKLMCVTSDELDDDYTHDAFEVTVLKSSDNLLDLKEPEDILIVQFNDGFFDVEKPVFACNLEHYELPITFLKKQLDDSYHSHVLIKKGDPDLKLEKYLLVETMLSNMIIVDSSIYEDDYKEELKHYSKLSWEKFIRSVMLRQSLIVKRSSNRILDLATDGDFLEYETEAMLVVKGDRINWDLFRYWSEGDIVSLWKRNGQTMTEYKIK